MVFHIHQPRPQASRVLARLRGKMGLGFYSGGRSPSGKSRGGAWTGPRLLYHGRQPSPRTLETDLDLRLGTRYNCKGEDAGTWLRTSARQRHGTGGR